MLRIGLKWCMGGGGGGGAGRDGEDGGDGGDVGWGVRLRFSPTLCPRPGKV